MANGLRVVSMTGFGSANRATARWLIETEVRSVNSRYLDVVVRTPDELRALEMPVRDAVSKIMTRGKVEVRVNLRAVDGTTAGALNLTALNTLVSLLQQLRATVPDAAPMTAAEMLRWPGVVSDGTQTDTRETLHEEVMKAVNEALSALRESREREGATLSGVILARIASARDIHAAMGPAAQRVRESYPARLRAKVESAGIAVDPDRLSQEIVLHAQRVDIDEELDRLNTHFKEVERVLAHGGDVGKRLDFLMQELNREANTLGSKSVDAETTRGAIDLKVLIEQMREQIQNLQ